MKNKKLIRQKFRDEVFSRDCYKCVFCGETNNLDAHHITNRKEMPNGGYVKENGITLCPVHHSVAEDEYWNGNFGDGKYHPDNLYAIINSSKELAIEKSELLTINQH